ncbi:MAG: hypothetical protein IT379_06995 [Deltaproteobacteria bacterium]|nr:hypothetical protein [Deltaproteobacteria bacterium]
MTLDRNLRRSALFFVVLIACASTACKGGGGSGGDDPGGDGGARSDGSARTPPTPPGSPPPAPGADGGVDPLEDSYVDGDGRRSSGMPQACAETCASSMDGECDDGATGSMYSVCEFGTDCMDCGMRDPASCTPDCTVIDYETDEATGEEREVMRPKTCGSDGCGGSCGACAEGECEDYVGRCYVCRPQCDGRTCGPDGCGGECGTCAAGQYCNGSTGVCAAGTPMCNDACSYAGDGDCDDGGAMCDFTLCEFGSDCTDCGMRTEADRRPDPMAACNPPPDDTDAGVP